MITLIGNLKGGTGKSTITFNLALWVATRHNKRVDVYDLDPQATTTDAFEIRREEGYLPTIEPKTSKEDLDSIDGDAEILIDMGMSDGEAVKRAVMVAERILVPVAPSQADVWSTQRFLKMVQELRGEQQAVEVLGVINRADTHRAVRETGEAAEALNMLPGIELLEPRLYMRTTYRRSFSEGLSVFEMEPRSKAAKEVDALGRVLYPV